MYPESKTLVELVKKPVTKDGYLFRLYTDETRRLLKNRFRTDRQTQQEFLVTN